MTGPPPLRDLILAAFSAVIWTLQSEIGFCVGCTGAGPEAGPCAAHQEDAELAGDFEAARHLVADSSDLLILAGRPL